MIYTLSVIVILRKVLFVWDKKKFELSSFEILSQLNIYICSYLFII